MTWVLVWHLIEHGECSPSWEKCEAESSGVKRQNTECNDTKGLKKRGTLQRLQAVSVMSPFLLTRKEFAERSCSAMLFFFVFM